MHHEIDSFGRASNEDAFTRFTCIYESFDLFACALVSSGRPLAQIVNAAMDVGVFLLDVKNAAVDNDLRDLRRRAIVEIDQRLAVYRLVQDWKVRTNTLDVPDSGWSSRFDCIRYCHEFFNPLKATVRVGTPGVLACLLPITHLVGHTAGEDGCGSSSA
jgi:hypothetical protein